MKPFPACMICALIVSGADAHAGAIRGTVDASSRSVSSETHLNAYAGRANSLTSMRMPQRGRIDDAVVYVESLTDSVARALPLDTSTPELVQIEQCFEPRVLAITAGMSVAFPNRDPIYHNVFSLSRVKRFDLGKYAKGRSKTVRFARPGLVTVHCDIHSNMEAFILVAPNAAHTQPNAEGAFVLPELPPGRYTVVLWHPDFGETRRKVQIPLEGDVDVELSY